MERLRAHLVVLAVLVAACGESPQGDPALFTAMKGTTPVFAPLDPAATSALRRPSTVLGSWVWADPSAPLYHAFQVLRDYTWPDDEGIVDMTNLYKVLFTVGRYMDDAAPTDNGPSAICATPIGAAGVTSPFDFGADLFPYTYDCGGNDRSQEPQYGHSVAFRQADTGKRYMLVGYKWARDPGQTTLGVAQASHDPTTGDVELNLAQRVQYTAGDGFGLRLWVVGNATTHAFTLRSNTDLVGKGVSQGEGNHFLFKAAGMYFCLSATATEMDLMALDQNGSASVDPACADYQADVDALVPFAAVPAGLSEFTGTEGIYLF